MKIYPDRDKAFPNPAIPSLCYIKNVVKDPRIIIGDYTYSFTQFGTKRCTLWHIYPFGRIQFIGRWHIRFNS